MSTKIARAAKAQSEIASRVASAWMRKAMSVTLGEAGLGKSFQVDFPRTTLCVYCGGDTRIGFVAHELDGPPFLSDMHPNDPEGEGFWLHDAGSVAIYFCKRCLNPTALYNQA